MAFTVFFASFVEDVAPAERERRGRGRPGAPCPCRDDTVRGGRETGATRASPLLFVAFVDGLFAAVRVAG